MKIGGVLLALVVLAALAGVGLYLINNGIAGRIFGGNVGSPFTVYDDGNNDTDKFFEGIRYGSNIDALDMSQETGWNPEYTLIWTGQWIDENPYGWQTFDDWLARVYDADSTPVVLWYYWANDTTQENIENGVGNKSVEQWYNMSERMADEIDLIMGDKGAIVVIEPEFNKYGMQNWTGFNDYLINVTRIFHDKNPNIKVAIGFGNWDNQYWMDFTPAVSEADMVGFSGKVRYPEQTQQDYTEVIQDSVAASQYLQDSFPGKPIIWYDYGASSFPEPDYYYVQQDSVRTLFENEDALESAGTRIVMYRHFKDVTEFNTEEDQHWGLVDSDGQRKPAYQAWISGVNGIEGSVDMIEENETNSTI